MKIKLIPIILLTLILAAILSVAAFADGAPDVTVTSVELNGSNDKVTVRAVASEEFFAENGENDIFLMELKPWSGEVIPTDAAPVAKTKLSGTEIELSTGFDVTADRYDSFVIAVKDSAGYLAVSQARFVDDASVFSADASAYPSYATKKGLVSEDYSDLVMTGSAQTVIDVCADRLMLPGYAENAVAYTYCGNTYYIDRAELDALDARIRALNGAGVNVFAQLTLSGGYRTGGRLSSLYFTDSRDGAESYALNTASDSATTSFNAFIDFIAVRYGSPDGENGFIGSWIVGSLADRISDLASGDMTDEQYVEYYQRELRMTDTAVRSVWKNARVYVPVSNEWSGSAKPFLSALAANVKSHGDFPWRVAVSAYPSDRTNASVWNDTWATEGEDTKYLSVKNLSVLTSFLESGDTAYNGAPRNCAVTSFAVNSSPDSPGDMTPAASFAYAYFKAAFDSRVDALIWDVARDEAYPEEAPQTSASAGSEDASSTDGGEDNDDADAVSSSGEASPDGGTAGQDAPGTPDKLYPGLMTAAGTRKPIYDVFTKIDAALPADPNYKAGDADSFALSIIGTPDWKNVAPDYDRAEAVNYNYIESMPIMSSDISGRIKTTSSFGFETGTGNFYPVGARYAELRTAEGPDGKKTALLYAGLAENGGSRRAGVACPMGLAASSAKYVTFRLYVEAPTDVASVAVNVTLSASGEESDPSLFVGTATVKPNSWQEVTFRCEDIASAAETLGTLSVFVSSYDGLDHAGNWGMMIDDLVTYGAKTSKLLPILGKLLVAALVIVVILAAAVLILRARNIRRAKLRSAERRGNK